MNASFFAEIMGTGKVLGLGVGDRLSAFDARLRFDYYEESAGRGDSRMLRRGITHVK